MENKIYEGLMTCLPKEKIKVNEPMSKHTSFRIGGNADFLITAATIEEVKQILDFSRKNAIPLTIMGNGTNLLVRDKGIRGIVLKLNLQNIEIQEEGKEAYMVVEAGVPIAKLSKVAVDNSLTGLEFACGIPGTVGGAIRMNAGAYGGEIKDVVEETTYLTFQGELVTLSKEQQKFSYRDSIFSKIQGIIIQTKIKLQKGNKQEIQKKVFENLKARREKQPLNYPNAGSTFKRGNGFITAKLIDDCGLKGYKVGDAMVSTLHAGFLVNTDSATCEQMLKLIQEIKRQVREKCNQEIELEVLVVGEE